MTRHYAGNRLFVLWGANILSAFVEGFGIFLFIPLMLRALPKDPREEPLAGIAGIMRGAFSEISIGALLAAIVVVFAAKGLLVYFVNSYRYRMTNRLRVEMRDQLIDGIARLDYRETTKRSSGYFADLVVSEVEGACGAIEAYCAALASLTTASLLLTSAVVLSPRLSVTAALAGGSSLFLLRFLSRRAGRGGRWRSRHSEALHRALNEALGPIKYLKATGRFGRLREEFHVAALDLQGSQDHLSRLDAARIGFQEPILVTWISFIFFWFGLVRQLNLSVISDSILFFYRTMIELGFLQGSYQRFATNLGALERVYLAETEFRLLAEVGGSRVFPGLQKELRFDKVSFAYDAREVLSDVSIVVPRHATVALVGLSGAGKTTLVDLVTGVLRPARGQVLIDGVPALEYEPTTFRERIGYVTQDAAVFDRTVAQNIEMTWRDEIDEEHRRGVEAAAAAAGCDEFIAELPDGYDTLIGERGVRLSGGQRQRLAIARELFRRPELLILDEATSSLDSRSEGHIRNSVEQLHGSLTILLISHRLSTIRHADCVYVLEDGRVIEQGTFDALAQAPGSRFRELCELQELAMAMTEADPSNQGAPATP